MKVFTPKTGNPRTDTTRVGFYGLTHNLWAGVALHDCTCINKQDVNNLFFAACHFNSPFFYGWRLYL